MTAAFYVVGGAVRDALLGAPASDRDWVAVGATPEELVALGYKPVGKDFPVFIHPRTGEEVALARTERKVGPGYHGFNFHTAPEVTLEEDLARRDLTINAIARAEDGTLIDPHGGRRDIAARVLRHVSEAFVEDPVRLLRLARLTARLLDFTVAPETMALLRRGTDHHPVALDHRQAEQFVAHGPTYGVDLHRAGHRDGHRVNHRAAIRSPSVRNPVAIRSCIGPLTARTARAARVRRALPRSMPASQAGPAPTACSR